MGRFRAEEGEHYGGQGGGGYFSLKNDKDVARVRFMYEGVEDVEGYAVHEIKIGDRKVYVNCLRDYNDPLDKCPFCAAHKPQAAKLFIPLYNVDTGRVQVWERGKKFFGKISGLCSRYPNLVSHQFDIERNGAAGSTQTTYEIYEVGQDKTALEDLPELPQILGGIVLEKSADDMEYFLQEEVFPPEDDEAPRRREFRQNDRQPERRTPSGRRDRF